jgi:hypothetical protein
MLRPHERFVKLLTAQPLDQPVELVHRRKLNRQFAGVLTLAVALELFFDAHFHLGHKQIGQFFNQLGIVRLLTNHDLKVLNFQAARTSSFAFKQYDSIPLHDCANVA